MKKILSAAVATLAAISFVAAAFAADTAKPVVPAGPVYVYSPPGELQNDAVKAAKKRETEETKRAEEKAKIDTREAEENRAKAVTNAAKAKAKADAAAAKAKDATYPAAR
jgi:hypothetical protein